MLGRKQLEVIQLSAKNRSYAWQSASVEYCFSLVSPGSFSSSPSPFLVSEKLFKFSLQSLTHSRGSLFLLLSYSRKDLTIGRQLSCHVTNPSLFRLLLEQTFLWNRKALMLVPYPRPHLRLHIVVWPLIMRWTTNNRIRWQKNWKHFSLQLT